MLKKKLLTGLVALILFGVAGCGGQNRTGDVSPLSENVPTSAPTTAAEAPAQQPQSQTNAPTQSNESTPDANTPVINFNISGGIAGFCDELNIRRDGSYTLTRDCGQVADSGTLTQADYNSLLAWANNLTDFQFVSEDNPGGPDNMVRGLSFYGSGSVEPDDNQRQVIFDWTNGLLIRLTSERVEVPTPAPANANGLCPDIERPALLTTDFENPNILTVVGPESLATCEITLGRLPVGRFATAGGSLFYPVFDPDTETELVLRLDPDGTETTLDFTAVPAAEQSPRDFVVAGDGSKIAWTQTLINGDTEPPQYTNSLWIANIDGSEQVAVLDQLANEEIRFVIPLRFSPDGTSLFYALQPDVGGPAFSGRLDRLYQAAVTDGSSTERYRCPEDNGFCINGASLDGSILAILQPATDSLQLIDGAGTEINSISLPATDYVERATFSPGGNLAFVSATLLDQGEDAPPLPDPGIITFLAPPYTDQPQTLLSNSSVASLWGWLDDQRLVYVALTEEGDAVATMLTVSGETEELSPYTAVGVLR